MPMNDAVVTRFRSTQNAAVKVSRIRGGETVAHRADDHGVPWLRSSIKRRLAGQQASSNRAQPQQAISRQRKPSCQCAASMVTLRGSAASIVPAHSTRSTPRG